MLEFIDAGFEAIIVSAKADLFGKDWIGKRVDREFLRYLKDNNIDVCGENGEYHTFVTYGPMFRKKIKITTNMPIIRDGYWFL
jgi:diphthine-ammonia ligase